MKYASVIMHTNLHDRLGIDASEQLVGVGNAAPLDQTLLGLICSRECPGHVLLETLEHVPDWVRAGCVVVSGLHSPLEQ